MSWGPGGRVLPGKPAELGGGPDVIKVYAGCCEKDGVASPIHILNGILEAIFAVS